jgi:hypothetical protein
MKTYARVEVSALDGGEWLASVVYLHLEEGTTGTRRRKRSMRFVVCQDTVGKRIILHCRK